MKRLSALLLIAAIALCAAACQNDSDQSGKNDNSVVGIWKAVVDDVTVYYDIAKDDSLTVYAESYVLETAYTAKQKDDHIDFTVTVPDAGFESFGAIVPCQDGTFTVTEGSSDKHDRKAKLTYPAPSDKEKDVTYQLTEVKKVKETKPQIPKKHKTDKKLLGNWLNNNSGSQVSQDLLFNKDGTMKITETYVYDNSSLRIIRTCGYTIEKSTVTLYYRLTEDTELPVEYSVKDDALTFGGLKYTRVNDVVPENFTESK